MVPPFILLEEPLLYKNHSEINAIKIIFIYQNNIYYRDMKKNETDKVSYTLLSIFCKFHGFFQ